MPDSVLRVLTCGSVDDGKSTLIGRLLFECGTIPDDVMAALERDSKRFGTVDGAIDYALLVDGLEAEREQGVTIDVAYRFFETPARRFILADTPGHQQYTRNMVTGASTADLAVLLIDARKGILPQTRRHAAIASLLGIRQVVLAVNKMDLVGFEESVFASIRHDFRALLGKLEFDRITPIPICARDGDNVTTSSARMPWYTGATLLQALESRRCRRQRRPARSACRCSTSTGPTTRSAAMPAPSRPGGSGPATACINAAAHTEAAVARIVTMDGDLPEAGAGDPVTLVLDREIDISRGDVLAADPAPGRGRRPGRAGSSGWTRRRCSAAAPIC